MDSEKIQKSGKQVLKAITENCEAFCSELKNKYLRSLMKYGKTKTTTIIVWTYRVCVNK